MVKRCNEFAGGDRCSANPNPHGNRTHVVFLFSPCFVALLVLISAYAPIEMGSVDELGFLNPPYMLAHFGRMTFPVFPFTDFSTFPSSPILRCTALDRPAMADRFLPLLRRSHCHCSAAAVVRCDYGAQRFSHSAVKLGWLFGVGYLAASGSHRHFVFGTRVLRVKFRQLGSAA